MESKELLIVPEEHGKLGKGLLEDSTADAQISIPLSELDCPICLKLIYDPITTPKCGHTTCRECLVRTVQTKKACPVCRAPLIGDPATFPSVAFIQHLLETYAPAQYKERRRETDCEKRQAKPRYGCFVSGYLHFPGQSVRLWVYEPRYRVMVNRALGTNKLFILVQANQQRPWLEQEQDPAASGMMAAEGAADVPLAAVEGEEEQQQPQEQPLAFPLPPQQHQPQPANPIRDGDIGVLARITMCQATPDGRSLIEVVATERVRLSNIEDADDGFGLLTAECSPVQDIEDMYQEEEEEEAATADGLDPVDTGFGLSQRGSIDSRSSIDDPVMTSKEEKQQRRNHRAARTARMEELRKQLLEQLSVWSKEAVTPMDRLELWHGPLPTDPSLFSFWLCRALPGETAEKEAVLASVSSEQRLEMCMALLESAIQANRKASALLRFFIGVGFLLLCVMAFSRLGGEDAAASSLPASLPNFRGGFPF